MTPKSIDRSIGPSVSQSLDENLTSAINLLGAKPFGPTEAAKRNL